MEQKIAKEEQKEKAHEFTVPNICKAIVHEVCELEDEYNWKWWKQDKSVNRKRVLEETVDIFHFFVCLCLKQGITPEELYLSYIEKNKENIDRQAGKIKGREDYAKK